MHLAAAGLFAAAAAAGPGAAGAAVEISGILVDDTANAPEPNEPNTVNDTAEPGETVSLSIELKNTGSMALGILNGELAVSYGGVTVSIGSPGPTMTSTFPAMDPNGTGVNDVPFVVPLLQTLPCGGRMSLELKVSDPNGPVARLWAPLKVGRCGCLDQRITHESAVRTLEERLIDPALVSRQEGYSLFYEASAGPLSELHSQPTGRFGEAAAVESFGQVRGGSSPDRHQFAVSALSTGFALVSSLPSVMGVNQPMQFRRLSLGGETAVGPTTLILGMQPLIGQSLALASSPIGPEHALVYVDPNTPTKLRLARLTQTTSVSVVTDVELATLSAEGAAAGPRPSVAYSSGFWTIVWEDFGNVSGVGLRKGIFTRNAPVGAGALSGMGTVRAPDPNAPGTDEGGAWFSSLATDGSNVAVLWSDTRGVVPGDCVPDGGPGPDPCPSAVYMRVLPPPPAVPMPGNEVRVSDVATPTGAAARPAAAWDPDLQAFEALWLDLRNDPDGACGGPSCVRQITLQRVKLDGSLVDEEGTPCAGGCNEQAWQDLAIAGNGPLAARSSDGTAHLIFAQDGNVLDQPFVGVRLRVDEELWVKQDPGEEVSLNDEGPLSAPGELGRAQGDLAGVWSETTSASELRFKLRRIGPDGLEPATVLVDSAEDPYMPVESSNLEPFAGGLAVAFVHRSPPTHVEVLAVDANDVLDFGPAQVDANDPNGPEWNRVRIAALGNRLGAVYGANGGGVKLQVLDAAGTPVSAGDVSVDGAGQGVELTALEDRFAVAYVSGGQSWLRFYDSNEAPVGGPVALTAPGNLVSSVAVAGLGDRVAVLYDEGVTASSRKLFFNVLDTSGASLLEDPNGVVLTVESGTGAAYPDLGLDFTGHELVASWTAPIGPPRWVRIRPDGTFPSPQEPIGFHGNTVHIAGQFDGNRFGFGVSETGNDLVFESFVPPAEAYTGCKIYNTSPTLLPLPEDPNVPLQVVLDANDPNAVVLTVTAEATSGAGGASDPGDDTLVFRWDLNCDLQTDFLGATLQLSSAQLESFGIDFPQSEPYLLCLSVTDTQGLSDSAQVELFVQDETNPLVRLTAPNGGESWPVGSTQRITWSASDDSELARFELYYSTTAAERDSTDCTDTGRGSAGWVPIDPNVPGDTSFFDWTVPNVLSATVRLCVVAVDGWDNSAGDISNGNLYFIQATTSAVRTVILAHLGRMEQRYPGSSGPLLSKLDELAALDSVLGARPLLLENVSAVEIALDAWDAAHAANPSTSQDEALAVAAAIHDYLWNPEDGQLSTRYTEARYVVLVGDDAILPALRIADGTGILPESSYGGLSALPVSTVEAALGVTGPFPAGAFLSDDYYGASAPLSTDVGDLWLPDLAVGRLIETPDEIQAQINRYIALDGVTTGTSALVMGYDFLKDSSEDIAGTFSGAGLSVESVIDDAWTSANLSCRLLGESGCTTRPTLYALNTHADHDQLGTPPQSPLDPLSMSDLPAGAGQMDGAIVLGMGCHSGLSAPASEARSQDVAQTLLGLGASVVIGQYGYGWGLQNGVGLTEELMRRVSEQFVVAPSIVVGDALVAAKQDYFLSVYRYDVFDHKVLQQTVFYGLPMLRLETGGSRPLRTAPLFAAAEQDGRQTRSGVIASKSTLGAPGGLTRLELNFAFDPNTFERFDTSRGSFYELNGIATAEIGNPLEPMFTYDSTLSGTKIRGVLFVGGGYTEQTGWNPVVGTPQSENTPDPGGEGPLPNSMGWVPIGRAGGGGSNRSPSRAAGGQSRLEVSVGHLVEEDRHRLFQAMDLVAYYSNDDDTTPPQIAPPGSSGVLHTGIPGGLRFSVTASDPGGALLRVLVTYSDEQGLWRSLDLTRPSGSGPWTGDLTGITQALYFVQAVDTAGNASYLAEATQDTDPSGDEWGTETVGPRFFAATSGTGTTPTPTATRTPPPTATRTATPPGPTPTDTPLATAVPAPGYRPELLALLAGLLPLLFRRRPRLR